MSVLSVTRATPAFVCVLLMYLPAAAQPTFPLSGRLSSSVTGEAVPGATVVLEELGREVASGADGTFAFDAVPPGAYHLRVRATGFSSRRTEVEVADTAVRVELQVDPELHFQEVVSVSPGARSQFESYQPTTVLAGQELTTEIEMSLGATLEHQPSVAVRSFGPAPARPVIRGLDGDRVLILQDGQRTGDLSSQSGDHGVVVNPAAARRIEVVRGPATLLYGANAIGGLVNVITDEIPTTPEQGVRGNAVFDLGSAADRAAAAGDLHVGNGTVALHIGGGGQRSGDVATPGGPVENSQARTAFGNVGFAWTGERGYVGGSYGYDDARYGIPVVEEGTLQLTPRRHALTVRLGAERLTGAFNGFRATLAHRRYAHEEVEGVEIGTRFRNDTTEVELMASHAAVGRLTGSIGAWILDRAFDAIGEEALSPAVDQRGAAVFLYEEVAWPHVTLQFGGRLDHTRFSPRAEARRSYTNPSFSAGALFRPAAADDALTIAVSVARAARTPALEELFFFGDHHGNFAFEVGNPDLASERALGLDLSVRWRSARVTGEVTVFRNAITDYIFRRPLTEEAFEASEDAFARRFPGRSVSHDHEEDEEALGFQLIEYVGADAVLHGVEAHADVQISPTIVAEAGFDYVRGTLEASADALPRIPPARLRAGLRYQRNAFQAGGEVVRTAAQRRVFPSETPTGGYATLRLFGAYSFQAGGVLNTLTLRLDNATDELYRNHLSLIKNAVPETGRDLKVLYGVSF